MPNIVNNDCAGTGIQLPELLITHIRLNSQCLGMAIYLSHITVFLNCIRYTEAKINSHSFETKYPYPVQYYF